MWTLNELNDIDRSVRRRYSGVRVLTEEKVGLSLKVPENDSASQTPVRKLTYEMCGMHYASPQYNLILLQDKINEQAGSEIVAGTPYSAPHHQINFKLKDGTTKTFDPNNPPNKSAFLKQFGL